MDIYREQILDHYKHPRNFGHMKKPDVSSEQSNVSCGDRIAFELKFRVHNSEFRVEDIRFHGEGCVISQASASMLTEKVKTMKLDDVRKLNAKDITDMLGTTLTPTRMKCAVLPLEVLHQAIASNT
jgi:nitrogen fixation NifU-like protein